MRSTIICVDDDKFLVDTLVDQIHGWFGDKYAIEKAISGGEALEILDDCIENNLPVPLVISDYIMPAMSGDELLTKVHAKDKSIRKIMLTGYSAINGIVNAINNAGLYRFVSKPWDKKDLMLTINEAIKSYNQEKSNLNLLQSFEKLYRSYESKLDHIINSVSTAVDLKTDLFAGHSQKVSSLSQHLGKKAEMNSDNLKLLRSMAAFHDIGKLILSDLQLNEVKSNETLIYSYPDYIVKQNEAARKIFSLYPDMDKALLEGVTNHYEKFDGSGVKKMKGKDIPLPARIIGVASFYDVLTGEKNVKNPLNPKSAVEMISTLNGSVFDPDIVELLREIDLDAM